jgi:hypothetical protein
VLEGTDRCGKTYVWMHVFVMSISLVVRLRQGVGSELSSSEPIARFSDVARRSSTGFKGSLFLTSRPYTIRKLDLVR